MPWKSSSHLIMCFQQTNIINYTNARSIFFSSAFCQFPTGNFTTTTEKKHTLDGLIKLTDLCFFIINFIVDCVFFKTQIIQFWILRSLNWVSFLQFDETHWFVFFLKHSLSHWNFALFLLVFFSFLTIFEPISFNKYKVITVIITVTII